jgi:hypothetical protein
MALRNHCTYQIKGLIGIIALSSSLMTARGQVLSPDGARLLSSDLAASDARTARRDLSCEVVAAKPFLGFDLRFHARYRATVQQKIFKSAGGSLSVLVRVKPVNREDAAYFTQQIAVPDLPAEAKGFGMFAGGFDLGPGRYEVDWTMHDRVGRACSFHWELEAKLGYRERTMPLTLSDNEIAEGLASPFDEEPASDRIARPGLRVKILLNLSPARQTESLLDPQYANVLVSMLRSIVREPDVRRVSLVAFNMRAQKIVYRLENSDTVDFSALGRVLEKPDAGTIDYRKLLDPKSESHFVTRLLIDELGRGTSPEDAIVILGSKVALERSLSRDLLKEGGVASCPIFYLNYAPNPFDEPFPDTIASALKAYNTASKFDIVEPRDFGAAMREMLVRLGRQPGLEQVGHGGS